MKRFTIKQFLYNFTKKLFSRKIVKYYQYIHVKIDNITYFNIILTKSSHPIMNNDSSNQKLNNIDNNTVYSPQLSDLEQEINTVKLLIYETNDNALQPKEYDIQKQSCLAQIQALIKKYESDTAAIKTISNSFFGYNMQNTNTAADIVISKDNDINNDKININNFDITKKILNFAQTNNAYNEYILKLAENADKIEIPVLKLLMQWIFLLQF